MNPDKILYKRLVPILIPTTQKEQFQKVQQQFKTTCYMSV
jgi:hypothetical protein